MCGAPLGGDLRGCYNVCKTTRRRILCRSAEKIMMRMPIAKTRRCGGGKLCFNVTRFVAVIIVALLIQADAFAYTLVLRSGRRVEIPANFSVTQSGVTYETASDINVTVQLTSIDVAATERVNHEASGSLLRRIGQKDAIPARSTSVAAAVVSTQARRTLTNKDLEGLRYKREQSEQTYERRRKQSGLPSSEELRRRREDEAARASEQLHQSEMDEAQAETYWRARASALRNELAVLDAQINYVAARLSELSSNSLLASPAIFGASIVHSGSYPYGYPYGANYGAQISGSINLGGGGTRVRIGINTPYLSRTNWQGRVSVSPGVIFPPVIFVPTPYSYYPYNQSYERSSLITRLHELEEARVGINARWRLLEEEARRAGAYPGWLRP